MSLEFNFAFPIFNLLMNTRDELRKIAAERSKKIDPDHETKLGRAQMIRLSNLEAIV
jgi:hypothetical protein